MGYLNGYVFSHLLILTSNPFCQLFCTDCKLSIPLCSTDNLLFLFSFSPPPRSCGNASKVGIAASCRDAFSFPSGCSLPHFHIADWFSQTANYPLRFAPWITCCFFFTFSPSTFLRQCLQSRHSRFTPQRFLFPVQFAPRSTSPAHKKRKKLKYFFHRGITSSPKSAYIIGAFFSHYVIPQAG